MIVVPMYMDRSRCPRCKRDEDRVTICGHGCGYTYGYAGPFWPIALATIVGLWVAGSVMVWALDRSSCVPRSTWEFDQCYTLAEMFVSQWYGLLDLLGALW